MLRYARHGKCSRCGACCLVEDPKCEHFTYIEGISTCKIYDSVEKPLRCKLFPEMPPIPFETCGFYFTDTWENNRKLKFREV